ncbi:hypothetical protein FXN63_08460 [Pigmentiphaga aceris]|uniref:Uncharacterized protein n=1 Tax=Pigmentiphaga aceris TaxID=1940612 RepID=A0A5C0AU99_9BURK|nr:hypothetical protein [Pigmentiphaga aceris]QEI05878.1 hypothetical protein FXN63_08460 [Pigmentiphaga aceris]
MAALLDKVEGGRPDANVQRGRRAGPTTRDWQKNQLKNTNNRLNKKHPKRQKKCPTFGVQFNPAEIF